MTAPLYPFTFKPVYRDYLWGGSRIITRYNRPEPDGIYAESWEVSTRPEGQSVVADGPLAGSSLGDLAREHGQALLGSRVQGHDFPLLIKLIDSRQRLSVQVHPDDETAEKHGGEAKTEMWYLLDTDEGAGVFAGLKPGTTPEAFAEAIEQASFEDLLVRLPVKPGDAVFMPGGTVHAIDAGCLILEVQQNSNTTYRIYDWGRVGADGKPRELHIDKALKVIHWEGQDDARVTPRRLGFFATNELWEILSCPYFRMERMLLKEDWFTALDGSTFHVLFCSRGSGMLSSGDHLVPLKPGTTCLVPAGLEGYQVKPDGEAEVLRVSSG